MFELRVAPASLTDNSATIIWGRNELCSVYLNDMLQGETWRGYFLGGLKANTSYKVKVASGPCQCSIFLKTLRPYRP